MKIVNQLFFSGCILISFSSCFAKSDAQFIITNSTNEKIDSFFMYPGDIKNVISINSKASAKYKIDMTSVKTDGSYGLFFKSKDSSRYLNFGYYSNGNPSETLTRIDIKNDTINVKPEF